MTDQNRPDDAQADTNQDTAATGDGREPLTTDDELGTVAEQGMPEVQSRPGPPGEDARPEHEREPLSGTGLEVDADGTDPVADHGRGPAGEAN